MTNNKLAKELFTSYLLENELVESEDLKAYNEADYNELIGEYIVYKADDEELYDTSRWWNTYEYTKILEIKDVLYEFVTYDARTTGDKTAEENGYCGSLLEDLGVSRYYPSVTIKFDKEAQKKINELGDDLFIALKEIGVVQ